MNMTNVKRQWIPVLSCCGAVAFYSPPGFSASGVALEEIVVTARKRAESLQDVPVTISAFSAGDLKAYNITSGKDIGAVTPGMTWKGDSQVSGNTVFLRGVGNNDTGVAISGAVAIYLDESYLASQPLANLAVYDIERIEVLKGPQGTLYGRNTTGGAVRFLSKQPEIGGGNSLDARIDVGNFDYVNVEGGAGFDLTETLAGRLSFKGQSRDGLYDDQTNGGEMTDLESQALRLQLLWSPSENLSIKPAFNYFNAESDGIAYKRVDYTNETLDGYCANPRPGTAPGCTWAFAAFGIPGSGMVQPDDDAYKLNTSLRGVAQEDLEVKGASLDVNYSFERMDLVSVTSFYEAEVNNIEDVDDAEPNLVNQFELDDIRQFSQELRLTSTTSGPLEWVAGVYYYEDKVESEIMVLGPNFGSIYALETESYSIFGEASYHLTDKFEIGLGLRWSDDEREVEFLTAGFVPPAGVDVISGKLGQTLFIPGSVFGFAGSDSWSKVSGRVVLTYHLDNGMLYGSFSRGFKSGEFNVGAADATTANFIEPEVVDAFELGYKSEWFEGRVRLNAAAFFYDYQDKQEIFFNNGRSILSNAQAEVTGFELDILAKPFERLTLNAALALLDTEYTDFKDCNVEYIGPGIIAGAGTATIDCTGNELTAAPETSLNLMARYDATIAERDLSLQVNGSYAADTFYNYENLDFNAQDGYWLVNARIAYAYSEQLTLALWAQNIADKEYFTDGFNISASGNSLLVPGKPRSFGLSVDLSF